MISKKEIECFYAKASEIPDELPTADVPNGSRAYATDRLKVAAFDEENGAWNVIYDEGGAE